MRVNPFCVTAALAAALAVAGCQKPATDNAASNAEANAAAPAATPAATPAVANTTAQGFVTTAAISDMYEIAAGKIAQKKATAANVKAFATRMIHDHTASTAAIKKALAKSGGAITPPADMDDAHKTMINALNQAAVGFDKTYMDQQVDAHTKAVSLFQGYSTSGDNPALKQFAATTLPTIQSHLDMANKIDGALK